RRGDEDEARGRGVHRRWAELGQVVELADQVVGHRPIAPAVARARLGEQLGQNGVGHRDVAGGKGVESHGGNLLNRISNLYGCYLAHPSIRSRAITTKTVADVGRRSGGLLSRGLEPGRGSPYLEGMKDLNALMQ